MLVGFFVVSTAGGHSSPLPCSCGRFVNRPYDVATSLDRTCRGRCPHRPVFSGCRKRHPLRTGSVRNRRGGPLCPPDRYVQISRDGKPVPYGVATRSDRSRRGRRPRRPILRAADYRPYSVTTRLDRDCRDRPSGRSAPSQTAKRRADVGIRPYEVTTRSCG